MQMSFELSFRFVNEQEIVSETTFIQLTLMVKECPLYIQTDGVGTRCNLRLSGTHIFISFREGQKGTSVNTFRIPLTSNGMIEQRSVWCPAKP